MGALFTVSLQFQWDTAEVTYPGHAALPGSRGPHYSSEVYREQALTVQSPQGSGKKGKGTTGVLLWG